MIFDMRIDEPININLRSVKYPVTRPVRCDYCSTIINSVSNLYMNHRTQHVKMLKDLLFHYQD